MAKSLNNFVRNPLMMRSRAYNMGWSKEGINKTVNGRFVGWNALPPLGLIAHYNENSIIGADVVTSWENQAAGGAVLDLDTPVGVTVTNLTRMGAGSARLPGASGDHFNTPDSVLNSVTGDIDIRWFGSLDVWIPAALGQFAIVTKWAGAPERAFRVSLDDAGLIRLTLSADGTVNVFANSSAVAGFTDGVPAGIRVTWTVASQEATFYTSIDGITWVQLGIPVALVIAGIADTLSPIEIGSTSAGANQNSPGYSNIAQVYSGIYNDEPLNTPFGPELVTNGEFTTDLTGFTTDAPATQTWIAGTAFVERLGAGVQTMLYQTVPLVAGKRYRMTLDIPAMSHSLILTTDNFDNIGPQIDDIGIHEIDWTAIVSDPIIYFLPTGDALPDVTVASYSIKELTPQLAVNFDPNQALEPQTPWVDNGTAAVWNPGGAAFVNSTGRDVVNSAGAVALKTAVAQLLTAPTTVFVVCRGQPAILSATGNIITRGGAALSDITVNDGIGDTFSMSQGVVAAGTLVYDTDPHVITAQYKGGVLSLLTVSGLGTQGPFAAGDSNWDFGSIFGAANGTSNFLGWIAEIAVYDRVLSDIDIGRVQAHLASKWL